MSDIRLYVIARTDMDTMTPGRVAAQVSHASTKMMYDLQMTELGEYRPKVKVLLENWLKEADGFGTTIVLKPKTEFNQDIELSNLCQKHYGSHDFETAGGLVIDPEYFIKDGNTCHIVKDVLTCAYFFGKKEDLDYLIGDYDLF